MVTTRMIISKTKPIISRSIRKGILFLAITLCCFYSINIGTIQVKADEATSLQVNFVGIDHSPILEGDTETFYITSTGSDRVQYRVILQLEDGTEQFLTPEVYLYDSHTGQHDSKSHYTLAVDSKVPFKVECSKKLPAGHHKLLVYARKPGWSPNGLQDYDSVYTTYINCISNDVNNKVYANNKLLTDKENYTIGDTVKIITAYTINETDDPYKYRLYIYNATKNEWVKNVDEYGFNLQWTPTEPGMYILDTHVDTPNSSTCKDSLSEPNPDTLYGTSEAWKLKVITVNPTTAASNSFTKPNLSQISCYGNGFIVQDGIVLFNSWEEYDHGDIVPYYALKDDFNPNINNQVYNILNLLIKDNKYVQAAYERSENKIEGTIAPEIRYCAYSNPKTSFSGFEYMIYEQKYEGASWYDETEGYNKYVRIDTSEHLKEGDSIDKLRECNRITLGNSADAITDFIINTCGKTKKSKVSGTFGNFRVVIEIDRSLDYFHVEIYKRSTK